MQKTLKVFGILATIGILLVILAGAIVSKTGSGDGCGPNWPLCHDKLIPENPTIETVIEYTHRLVTLVVGTLVLIFSIWSGIKYRKNREVLLTAIAALFFLLLQSILGAMAVVYGQSSAVLALHFGISLLSYASLFVLTIYVFQLSHRHQQLPTTHSSKGFKIGLIWLFIGTYLVVYSGAYVRHTNSMLGCKDWPLCNGQLIPTLTGQVGIQFMHRVAALLLFIGFILLLVYVYKHYRHNTIILGNSILLFILLVFQIILGGIVILTELDFAATLSHALIIIILFGIQSYLTLYVLRKTV